MCERKLVCLCVCFFHLFKNLFVLNIHNQYVFTLVSAHWCLAPNHTFTSWKEHFECVCGCRCFFMPLHMQTHVFLNFSFFGFYSLSRIWKVILTVQSPFVPIKALVHMNELEKGSKWNERRMRKIEKRTRKNQPKTDDIQYLFLIAVNIISDEYSSSKDERMNQIESRTSHTELVIAVRRIFINLCCTAVCGTGHSQPKCL